MTSPKGDSKAANRLLRTPASRREHMCNSTALLLLSACGVADEWVTQLLGQSEAKVFKKYSQMKLQMKREALAS